MTEKSTSPGMTNTATHGDVDIILRLYEMRREPVMREARRFMTFEFWPSSFEDLGRIMAAGGKEFAYFRQVTSYWDMAMSFVARERSTPAMISARFSASARCSASASEASSESV